MTASLSPEILDELKRFDSPTISNVIEVFDVRPRSSGYMNASIKALFPEMPAVVGYASTLTFRSARARAKDEEGSDFIAHLEELVKLPAPRIVVFEDLDNPSAAATFGEVMCAVYQRLGCVGLITSGSGRDVDVVKRMGFPVFASGVCVSHGYGRFEDVHRPVHVGGLTIHPGDLIHADGNGIVVIPDGLAEDVAKACGQWIKAERVVLDYLKEDEVTLDGLRGAFAQLKVEMEAITRTGIDTTEGLV
jgi:regulator of RNase E activity RraA